MRDETETPFTESWFASGQRLGYDPRTRTIDPASPLKVWARIDGDPTHAVTFLPGYPDGSTGWGKVLPHLPDANAMPKIFVEYVGMGDSDKPRKLSVLNRGTDGSRGSHLASLRRIVYDRGGVRLFVAGRPRALGPNSRTPERCTKN
jgi:pimeloyl-ACP methyl ester carboxylesterase